MRKTACVVPLLALTFLSCTHFSQWSSYAVQISEQLACDMGISDVEEVAGKSLTESTGASIHGDRMIVTGGTNIHLGFKEERLKWYRMTRPDGWRIMAIKMTPKFDLCSNRQLFLVRLLVPAATAYAEHYLNSERLNSFPELLELEQGEYRYRMTYKDAPAFTYTFSISGSEEKEVVIDLNNEVRAWLRDH
ncbi:MAG: hypothetical protein AAF772_04765 [Acidobacteriota bacterium]